LARLEVGNAAAIRPDAHDAERLIQVMPLDDAGIGSGQAFGNGGVRRVMCHIPDSSEPGAAFLPAEWRPFFVA
jgi:hypothetical protein